jgi:PAS domain S-box-containing protein
MTKQLSKKIAPSGHFCRMVFEYSVDGLLVIDAEGIVQFANPAAIALFGHRTKELVGFYIGIPAIYEPVELLLPRGSQTRYVEMRSAQIVWAGRTASLASLRDITDRKQAEAARQRADQRFREALDSMLEGCTIINFEWTYLYLNDVAAGHGLNNRENLIGRKMTEAYPEVQQSEIFSRFRLCMEQRIPQHFESPYNFADGNVRFYKLSVVPVPEGIFVLSLDTTEHKRTEEVLRRQAEEVGKQNEHLINFNRAAVGRELRMIELKREVNELSRKLGLHPLYQIAGEESVKPAIATLRQ